MFNVYMYEVELVHVNVLWLLQHYIHTSCGTYIHVNSCCMWIHVMYECMYVLQYKYYVCMYVCMMYAYVKLHVCVY